MNTDCLLGLVLQLSLGGLLVVRSGDVGSIDQIDGGIGQRRKVFRGGVEMGTEEKVKICVCWGYLLRN